MAETSTIFGFMKYVSATDILSDFKKTVDSYFVNSLTLGISKGFKVKDKLLSHLSSNFFSKVFFAFFDTFTSLETYESYYFSLVVFQELRNLSFRF